MARQLAPTQTLPGVLSQVVKRVYRQAPTIIALAASMDEDDAFGDRPQEAALPSVSESWCAARPSAPEPSSSTSTTLRGGGFTDGFVRFFESGDFADVVGIRP